LINNETIIQEIDRFILRFEGIYSNFYVGITDNPMRRIHDEHEIGQAIPYFFKEAENTETARMIERYFIDHGCDGGEGNEDSVYIYAYKKGPRSKP
jgi:hypothetical protein